MSTITRPARRPHTVRPTSPERAEASVNYRFIGPVLAVTRIATGLIFLWAFLDKAFGLGYATPAARAWVNGGSPTAGFLGHADVGPLRGLFQAMAGNAVVDWLFMIGLLGIGVALVLGIGLRIAAIGGTVMMLAMWAAEWPLAQFTASGEPTGSTNPVIEYHVIYALVLIVLAVTAAGRHWGLGTWWERLVGQNRWLV